VAAPRRWLTPWLGRRGAMLALRREGEKVKRRGKSAVIGKPTCGRRYRKEEQSKRLEGGWVGGHNHAFKRGSIGKDWTGQGGRVGMAPWLKARADLVS